MKTSLYGREYELGWLQNRVIRMPECQNLPGLTLIYGSPGIGKTALLDAFLDATLERQNQPMVFFRPEISAGIFGVEMFAESMFRSARACPSSWAQGVHQLGEQFWQNLVALRRGEAPVATAYSPQGTVASAHAVEKAVVGDPRGYLLSELCVETLTTMGERVAASAGHLQGPGLVLCFDQFSDYAPSVKRWVGSVLMQALMRSQKLAVPRILLTGRESMDSDGQSDYWEVPLGRIHEIELKAINRSSCIKWLVDEGIKPDVIDELMERTKGVPQSIHELILDKKTVKALEAEIDLAEKSSSVSVREQRWLHAAAVLEYVDKEGLAVVLGQKDAELAFDWLKQQVTTNGILLVDSGGLPQIFLASELRRKIIGECASRYPDRHKDFRMKFSIQKRLLEEVPSSVHREYLRRLVPIEPFDLEMIDKIYGGHE